MDHIDGGCLLPIAEFFNGGGRSSHTGEQKGRPVVQADLDATNALQETGRRINRELLTVAKAAVLIGHPAVEASPLSPPQVPNRIPKDAYAALEPEARRAASRARQEAIEVHEVWRSEVSRTSDLLTIAERDVDHPHLYTVFAHDSRLRRYPRVGSGPNPQGAGLSRALLEFDDGVEVGSRGIYWLAVRAGTMAGLDKLTHDKRAEWASENTQALIACAEDPLSTEFWWKGEDGKGRDDPWGLLATAMELRDCLASPSPGGFKSHLPVHVDGTCNGLQHLSALGLDPVGALATNLTSSPDRHDIYELVAERVRERVHQDTAAGLEVARGWQGNVTRDTVKRGCMTTAYGVTLRGMRDQLVDDGHVSAEDHEDVSAAAGYMRDVMWAAIGEVVTAARNIMDWLQTTASALAATNIPLSWEVPTGSLIRQSYRPWATVRPLTAFGRVHISTQVDKGSLKPRKCALAAAPNFIHSFDAAHMALTINSAGREGITHFDMIHDSYGTHAAHMDTLNRVLREEFVGIYEQDWLAKTYGALRASSPNVLLPPPPVRGEFDISQVRQSPWFFA